MAFRQITGAESFPILLAFGASEVSSIDGDVNDMLKAAERQSDEESTGNVSAGIEETLARIKQRD